MGKILFRIVGIFKICETSDSHSCADQEFSLHIIYDMIYLLTATGLTPGGSSTVHKQYNDTWFHWSWFDACDIRLYFVPHVNL
jgi:hypothetical protein